MDAAIIGDPGFITAGGRPRPPGFVVGATPAFDWNGDGQPDTLTLTNPVVGFAQQRVSLNWAGGSLTIMGVVTNEGADQPLENGAAIADVTGDGAPDLLVESGGVVVVVPGGSGSLRTTETLTFSQFVQQVQTQHIGWVSPPVSVPGGKTGEGTQLIEQAPPGSPLDIEALWDITGDGIPDFSLTLPTLRSTGETFYYAGKPCIPV